MADDASKELRQLIDWMEEHIQEMRPQVGTDEDGTANVFNKHARSAVAELVQMLISVGQGKRASLIAIGRIRFSREAVRHFSEWKDFFQDILDDVESQAAKRTADGLLTIEQLAHLSLLSVKTLRNRQILGGPEISGGGRGKKSQWRYSVVKPRIETALSTKLPTYSDALKALAMRAKESTRTGKRQ